MKLIIDIPENKIDDCKLEVSFIGQEGWMYSPKQNWIINKENGVELDDLDIKSYIANGKPLQAELEEIKEAFCDMRDGYPKITDETLTVRDVIEVIDKRIAELKGENNETDN